MVLARDFTFTLALVSASATAKRLAPKPRPRRLAGVTYTELTSGNDDMTGTSGDDFIDGIGGLDTLSGGDGNDRLKGGASRDWLYGDEGNDILIGQADGDYIYGGMGDDTLMGGTGDDYLYDTYGANRFFGGPGDDFIYMGQAYDDVSMAYPGPGNDQVDVGNANGASVYISLDDEGTDEIKGMNSAATVYIIPGSRTVKGFAVEQDTVQASKFYLRVTFEDDSNEVPVVFKDPASGMDVGKIEEFRVQLFLYNGVCASNCGMCFGPDTHQCLQCNEGFGSTGQNSAIHGKCEACPSGCSSCQFSPLDAWSCDACLTGFGELGTGLPNSEAECPVTPTTTPIPTTTEPPTSTESPTTTTAQPNGSTTGGDSNSNDDESDTLGENPKGEKGSNTTTLVAAVVAGSVLLLGGIGWLVQRKPKADRRDSTRLGRGQTV